MSDAKFTTRRSARGVALVEAAVIAPVYALFWLMMIHISGVYQTKIATAQESRYQAFYYATNNCESSGSSSFQGVTSSASRGESRNSQTNDGTAGGAESKGQPVVGQLADNLMPMAVGRANATWSYNKGNTIEYGGGQTFTVTEQTVKTESYVLCNEKPLFGSLSPSAL
jgi:hypothetical protein